MTEHEREVEFEFDGTEQKPLKMPLSHARMSGTIANMLDDIEDEEDNDTSKPISLPPFSNIKHNILEKVVDFCANKPDAHIAPTEEQKLEMRTKPLEGYDLEFVEVPLATLFEMINAANFLDLKPMLDVCCKAVAEMIKGKTPDEIKKVFGVEGDFTQEEKEEVLRNNPWLEDPEEETFSAGGGGAASE